jgi:THO complex subunit 2
MRRQVSNEDPESEKGVASTKKLKEVLTMLGQKNVISQRQALEILEAKTLGAIAYVNEQNFVMKNRSFFTRTYFEQQKFNLLREENEGFAKLIIELNQGNIGEDNIRVVKQNIQSLIGYFSLDPNRLIDLLLSAFENNVQNLSYLSLLREFGTRDAITQLIGFKI